MKLTPEGWPMWDRQTEITDDAHAEAVSIILAAYVRGAESLPADSGSPGSLHARGDGPAHPARRLRHSVTLPPLGWRLEHDSALDGRIIHRVDCELVTDAMPRAPAGALLERHQAPVPCPRCRPEYVSQLA